MKRYGEYTTIDSRWANYIPASWTFSKIAEVFIERKETNDPIKTTDILSLTNTRGVIPYREKGNVGNKAKEDLTGYRLAYPEDIVFNSMNAVIGSVGLSKYFGAVSPVYYMLYLRDTAKNNIHFFDYVFQDRVFQSGLNGLGNGILEIRMRIPMSKLKYVGVPVPPRTEQDQIVRYLDWQVSKINRLIAAKRKEIALLKEHRTAKINQAVTTGIHCDTQLAYTGYNWLPYAPANWKPVPAKALFRNITELRRLDDSMLAATQKYGLIEQTEYMRLEGRRIVLANDNLDKWLHTEPNDFIISLRSFQGGLEMCSKPGCVTWHYVVLRSRRNIYALNVLAREVLKEKLPFLPQEARDMFIYTASWQDERISLIKKECHQYDREWRMLLSTPYTNRPFIKLKPQSVLIGLRTPDYEKQLILSAARIAGIQEIYQVVINDDNLLGKQKISEA
mgnify:CR=1 FL=1